MLYIKECGYIIVSLKIEILEEPWKSIKVWVHRIFRGVLNRERACGNYRVSVKKYLVKK